MGKHDGEVVIGTGLDNSGIQKDIGKVRGDLGGLKKVSDDLSKSLKTALSDNGAEAGSAKIEKLKAKIASIKEQSGSLGAELDGAKAKLAELLAQKEKVSGVLEPDGTTYVDPDAYIDAYMQKDDINKAVEDQQNLVFKLQKEWDAVNDKLDSYKQKLDQANASAEALPNPVNETKASIPSSPKGKQLKKENSSTQKALISTQKNVGKLGKSISQLGKRLSSIMASALVFNVISSGLREMTSYLGQTLRTNKEFTAQTAKLRAALLTAFQPIYEFVVPALTALISVLTTAVAAIASFFAALTGSTLSQSAAAAEALYKESDALNSVGSGAKKASKSLAAFDEINALQANTEAGGGVSSTEMPDFSFADAISPEMQSVIERIAAVVKEIAEYAPVIAAAIGGISLGKFIADLLTANIEAKTLKETLALLGKKAGLTIGVALSFAGAALEIKGIISAVQEGLNGINFAEILGGGGLLTGGGALIGQFFGKSVIGAAIGAVVAGIPMFITGIYDAIVRGINWLNATLVGVGATAAGAGIGAVIGMLGGPISAGVGALVGFAVGLVTDLVVLIVQKWDEICAFFAPAAEWFDTNVIQPLGEFFSTLWASISQWASETWADIVEYFSPAIEWFSELLSSIEKTFEDIFYNIGVIARGCWEIIQYCWDEASSWFNETVIQPVSEAFVGLWEELTQLATSAWEIICVLYGAAVSWFDEHVAQPLSAVFLWLWEGFLQLAEWAYSGAEKILSGLCGLFRGILNGVISLLNSAISGIFSRINNILSSLKNISIGGFAPFANIRTISVPQIPYLAQGAVLPPNKPFLAMVGDQRYGTNIEAPLSTIQEAVALVMQDIMSGNMAGHQATVAVLQDILQTVEGIQIGDTVIGQAANRYQQKMAVMRGG